MNNASAIIAGIFLAVGLATGPFFDASAGELLLDSLKNGSQFEVVDTASVPIPPALALLGDLPTLQATDGAFGFASSKGTTEPACLIGGLTVNSDTPDKLNLPKGSKIQIEDVKVDKKPQPPYAGTSVSFSIHSSETPLKATLRCFAGKASKTAMPVELFEKLFRRKIRLLVHDK